MDTKILRDYLEKVRLLETDIYTYDKVISSLQKQRFPIREKPMMLPEPVEPNKPDKIESVVEPEKPKEEDNHASGSIFKFSILALLGGAFLASVFSVVIPIPALASFFEIAAGLGLCVGLTMGVIKRSKENRAYEVILEQYKEKRGKYKAYLLEKEKRINYYNQAKGEYEILLRKYNLRLAEIKEYEQRFPKEEEFNRAIEEEIRATKAKKAESESALTQLYEQDIIYRKYRGLVPVTMFCEYIDSGRRTEFEGIHGMYDLYETELLGKKIIGELSGINEVLGTISNQIGDISGQIETISNRLTGIQRNQILLYKSVAKGNAVAQSLSLIHI